MANSPTGAGHQTWRQGYSVNSPAMNWCPMQKSFARMVLEGTIVSALILFVLFAALGAAAGKLPMLKVFGVSASTAAGCGLVAGLFYAGMVRLGRLGRQEREAVLPCDFQTACALCLRSFELFPNRQLIDSTEGNFEALVNNNPMLKSLPASMTPQKWGWVERVKLTVSPASAAQSTVKIETYADMNRALQVAVERKRHNADIIREFLECQCREGHDGNRH